MEKYFVKSDQIILHCLVSFFSVINNVSNVVTMQPLGEAQTYVNGCLITSDTVLHHGDRVILGGDHYFR